MPSRCGGTVARAQVDTCSLTDAGNWSVESGAIRMPGNWGNKFRKERVTGEIPKSVKSLES